MSLSLTKEFQELLGDKVTSVEVDVPMKAMDTLHVGDKKLEISPCQGGFYIVDLWADDRRLRRMHVVCEQDSEEAPFPSPAKYIDAVRL